MRILIAAGLAIAVAAQTAWAAGSGPAQPPPLPGAAAVCANCHGTDGRRQGAIPAIAGRPAALLSERLRQFRADAVADATVMPRLIKGLTDAEIDQAASYFSSIR